MAGPASQSGVRARPARPGTGGARGAQCPSRPGVAVPVNLSHKVKDGWAGSQADADGPPGMENGLAGGTGELPRRPQSSPRPQDNYYGGPKEMGW
ncbi:PREDICTED: collagen alpha-1(III) chain-like isoform X1 [Bison bison bison]|uniref:Collagen alpha-1(III) chain-like isoform X1 n=1 Tax=Bison bison bison TaxID=43346 RepID=A0A6P3HSI7_BISBB|nr:PREDICTED: collagen alpha-1(III) chain-like isoform X1 [Bison bison bison]